MIEKYTCLEATLGAAQTEPDAVLMLRGMHQFYGEGEVTAGYPVPVAVCPRRQCGRDRVIEFIAGALYAQEDTNNPTACHAGQPEVAIETLPAYAQGEAQNLKPEPPPILALGA